MTQLPHLESLIFHQPFHGSDFPMSMKPPKVNYIWAGTKKLLPHKFISRKTYWQQVNYHIIMMHMKQNYATRAKGHNSLLL